MSVRATALAAQALKIAKDAKSNTDPFDISESTNFTLIDKEGVIQSNVNTVRYGREPFITRNNVQYGVYVTRRNELVNVTVFKRDLNIPDTFEKYDIGNTTDEAIEDNHNYWTINMDGQGYLHVFGGIHSAPDPVGYFISDQPYDISSFSEYSAHDSGIPTVLPYENGSGKTYPHFLYSPYNNEFYLFMRMGTSSVAQWYLWKWNYESKQYETPTLVFNGSGNWGIYTYMPKIDSHGDIHFFYMWRASNKEDNQDLSYVKRTSDGVWMKTTGETLTLPITRTSVSEIVYDFNPGDGLVSFGDTAFDKDGNPHCSVLAFDEDGHHAIWVIRYKNGQWLSQIVFKGQDIMRVGNITGDQEFTLSRPGYIIDDNTNHAYALFRSGYLGGGLYVASSRDGDFNNWKIETLVDTSLGAYQPIYDYNRWVEEKVLDIYIQTQWVDSLGIHGWSQIGYGLDKRTVTLDGYPSLKVSPVYMLSWDTKYPISKTVPTKTGTTGKIRPLLTYNFHNDITFKGLNPSIAGSYEDMDIAFCLDVRDLPIVNGDRLFIKVMSRIRSTVYNDRAYFKLKFHNNGGSNSQHVQEIEGTEISSGIQTVRIESSGWAEIDPVWASRGGDFLINGKENVENYTMVFYGMSKRDATGFLEMHGTTVLIGVLE